MKALHKTLTHLAAAGLGMALAISAPGIFSRRAKSAATTHSPDATASTDASAKRAASMTSDGGRAAEFRRAWASLSTRVLSHRDLMELQIKLLKQWAEVDLEGAMEAALAEPWDSEDPFKSGGSHPLGEAFSSAFAERPLEAWKILSSGKLGPGAQLFRRPLVATLARKDGMLAVSMLGEFTPSMQEVAIACAMQTPNGTAPAPLESLLKKIATSGNPEQVTSWLRIAYSCIENPGAPSELRDQWSSAPPGSGRVQAMTGWAASLRRMDREQFADEWAQVPESDRGEAAKSVLSQLRHDSPALLDAIGHAIDADEWAYLEKSVSEKIGNQAMEDPKGMADWALTLPARKEATDLYQQAVTSYLMEDPDGGREWLESLPEGDWHRERGFVALSQAYLWQHDDPEGSRRAIESITDPVARRNATTYRYDWALQQQKPVISH